MKPTIELVRDRDPRRAEELDALVEGDKAIIVNLGGGSPLRKEVKVLEVTKPVDDPRGVGGMTVLEGNARTWYSWRAFADRFDRRLASEANANRLFGLSDKELLELCRGGDKGACGELDRRGVKPPIVEPPVDVEENDDEDEGLSGRFVLEINLGNAEMLEQAHIARALREVAYDVGNKLRVEGLIRDLNGNTVGSFRIEAAAPMTRRIFLSSDTFNRVSNAWAVNASLSRRLDEAEQVEDGYIVELDEIGVDHVRELGIGIVNYVEGMDPDEAKRLEREGRRS
jgi:hypothetical protein